MNRCPGQDQRYWKPEDVFEVRCAGCGKAVEFFKDEPQVRCRNCGRQVVNPRIDLGCAQWCRYGQECLHMMGMAGGWNAASLREVLLDEVKKIFAGDEKRVRHTLAVLEYAEKFGRAEVAEALVVTGAAILHDVGIAAAEEKYGSSAGHLQEREGPPIAREILQRCGVDAESTEHICRVVGSHHSGRDLNTAEFRAVWDADRMVNFEEVHGRANYAEKKKLIDKLFRTAEGRRTATQRFVSR